VAVACVSGAAFGGSLDGATSNGPGQIAYGPDTNTGRVDGFSNAMAIGMEVDNAESQAKDFIAIGSQLRNNAASSILMGNNGVELDRSSANSVVFSPESTGGVQGGKWAQPVTKSAANFSFISLRAKNRVNSSDGAVALAGSAANASDAVSIGTSALVSATEGVAVGRAAQANGEAALALGAGGIATGARAVALGGGARAVNAGDVALGADTSTTAVSATPEATIAGTTYGFAGTAPNSTVSIGSVSSERTLTNMAAGRLSTSSTDAVNGSQLNATNVAVTAVDGAVDRLGSDAASRLGGGSTYEASTGVLAAPTYNVGGKTANNVGDALTSVDGRVGQVDQRVTNLGDQLNNGSIGLVQQNATTRNITVAKDTDGNQVSFAGTAGDRVLTNVARGAVSATSVEAVNGSQLFGTNKSVVDSLGGGSKVNPDGTISGPTYTVDGKPVKNVGDAISNIDGRTTSNTTNITNVDRRVTSLGDQLNSGTLGLVQQDATSKAITVAKDTDGKQVSFAGTAGDRVLTNVAKGAVSATSVEAVNGSQLFGTNKSVVDSLGGGSRVNTDGTISGPTYTVDGKPVNNVGDAISNIDGRTTNNTSSITNLGNQLNSGTVGLVQQDATSRIINVAKDKDGKQVSFAGTEGDRVLTNVAKGAVNETSVQAVNGAQLFGNSKSVADSLGGGSRVNPDGTVSKPTYTVGGNPVQGVEGAINNLDGRTTNNSTAITNLGDQINSGTTGLVQQDATTKTITVAKAKDGKQVSFAGTEGDRVLTGVAKGAVNETSVQAVNGAQLFSTNTSVADGLGGGSRVNPDGTVSAPTYTVGGQPVNNVGDAITHIDRRTTGNTTNITNNSTAITRLGDEISKGTLGLVQQHTTSRDILVAGDKDGRKVSFAGTQGNRVLLGVAGGAVNKASVEAINGSQLHATNQAVVDALGGGSKVNPDGSIGAPTYTVAGKPVSNVGDALTNIDGRTTSNTTAINQLGDQISNGGLGLVKQDAASREITVASDKDGKQVTFAGSAGERVLAGVAKGEVSGASVQAVNGSQLHATSKSVADTLGGGAKVNPDGTVSGPTYTVGGNPVSNVGDAITNVDGRVTHNTQAIQNIVGSGGVKYFRANSTAAAAEATGINAVAAGPESVASGSAAVAIGHGAQAIADNSVAIGAGAVADRAHTVAVGRAGQERTISHVAAGSADTDAVNVSQLRNSQQGAAHYDRPTPGAAPDYSSLSLGGPGGATTTQVRNVSQGVAPTDAVNVQQLHSGMEQAVSQSRSYTDAQVQALGNDMWQLQRESRAGTASAIAMAGLVQAYEAGDSLVSVGMGGFQGEYSMAMGLSGVTEDGKYLYKAQASSNTRKDFGFSVSAGWRW